MSRLERFRLALDVLTFALACGLFVYFASRVAAEHGMLGLGLLLVASIVACLLADYVLRRYARWKHARGVDHCNHERVLHRALYLLECHVDTDLGSCDLDVFGECSRHWPRDVNGDCAYPATLALLSAYPVEAKPDVQPVDTLRPPAGGSGGEGPESPARGAGQEGPAKKVASKVVRWSGTLGMVDQPSVDHRTLARPEMFVAYRDTPLPLTVRGSDGQAHIGGTILGVGLLNQNVVAHGVLRVDYLTEHAPELLELLRRGEDAPVGLEVEAVEGDFAYGDDASLTFHTWTIRGAMLGNGEAAWPEARIRLDAEDVTG